ncbi:MAG: PKD domain-containing protein, partial [Flavobacteriales bacterium]|nr:PKD domain-containing protein [Flavobacteriales bacterium]
GAAPVAEFSADDTNPCDPQLINFADASTNTPTSWSWDSGDGFGTSTSQNPSYTYLSTGTYTVTLTATNAFGNDAEVKTSYMVVDDVPAMSSAVNGSTLVCENITGEAYSCNVSSGASSYTWVAPVGGSVASGQGTTNITVDFGIFEGNVEVTPSNHCGSGPSTMLFVSLQSCAVVPVAAFGVDDTNPCVNTSITFTDTSTNTPTSWSWDFGDGFGTSTSQNPSYSYFAVGTYTVTLTATNASGSDAEVKTSYITVIDVPSLPGPITGSTTVCEFETGVVYSCDPVAGATSYGWLASGGTITSGIGTTSVTVDFGAMGPIYDIEVFPTNACGSTITGPLGITVQACAAVPVAEFSADQTSICQGTGITFTDASTNTPTSWSWNLGDGSPVNTAQNPNYTYAAAGTYTVTLTSTNASGRDNEVKTSYITVGDVAGNAGAINGSTSECENATTVAYSIAAVANADSYSWTVPTGAIVASGQGTTNITVDFGTASGTVEVTPVSSCGNGGASNVTVTLTSCSGVIQLTGASCGLVASSMSETVVCNAVAGASLAGGGSRYKLRFHNPAGGADLVKGSPTTTFTIGLVGGIQYGVTYEVYAGWKDASGLWTEGTMCNVTTPTLVATQLTGASCGLVATSLSETVTTDEVLTAEFAGGGSKYKLRFHNPAGGTDLVKGSATTTFTIGTVTGILSGVTYDVYASWKDISGTWQPEGVMCNVTTPGLVATQLTGASCGLVASSLSESVMMDEILAAEFAGGGSKYKLRFHNPAGGTDLIKGSASTSLIIGSVGGILYGVTYDVYVSWKDISGTWQPEGAMCNVTTPTLAVTQLTGASCGLVASSLSETVTIDEVLLAAVGGGGSKYKLRLHNPAGGADLIKGSTTTTFTLNEISGIQLSTTYDVYASWRDATGAWQPEGAMCNVTTPATLSKPIDNLTEYGGEKVLSPEEVEFKVNVFPNPVRENLKVQWETSNDVIITMVNLVGKVICQEMISNSNSATIDMASQSSGIYILRVTAGDRSTTIKVMKE